MWCYNSSAMPSPDESHSLAAFPVAGILGHKIDYTLSPMLHRAAEEGSGRQCDFQIFDIEPDKIDGFLKSAHNIDGLVGFNVTKPHKEAAAARLDALHESAREVGAVNTVAIRGGHLIGYNTDRPALAAVIKAEFSDKELPSDNWTVVLLGAGGAARAAIWSSIDSGILRHLVVMSRNQDRVHRLKNDVYVDFTRRGYSFSWHKWMDWATLYVEPPSILINATPLGTDNRMGEIVEGEISIPETKFGMFDIVIDLVYSPPRTKLMQDAESSGVYGVGGAGMLIEQALLSRNIWFGDADLNKERAAMVAAYTSWSRGKTRPSGIS